LVGFFGNYFLIFQVINAILFAWLKISIFGKGHGRKAPEGRIREPGLRTVEKRRALRG